MGEWDWISELIAEEEGREVVLKKAQGLDDATKPGRGNASFVVPVAPFEGIGVFADYRAKEIDGALIRKNDQKVLMAPPASGEDFLEYDMLLDGGTEYKIIRPEKIEPDGEILLYILQIRR